MVTEGPGRGFTLVEMLVALVVGLVVVLSAVAFIAAVSKANSEEIQVTRLMQEARALSEVISREIRRARYVADTIGLIGQGSGVTGNDLLEIQGGGTCIVFEYDESPDGAQVSRSLGLAPSGRVVLGPGGSCSAGNAISSPQIEIVDLRFVQVSDYRLDQTLTVRLADAPPDLQGLTRTFRQTIYIRSGQVN